MIDFKKLKSKFKIPKIKIPKIHLNIKKKTAAFKKADFLALIIGVALVSMLSGFLGGILAGHYLSWQLSQPFQNVVNLIKPTNPLEQKPPIENPVYISQEQAVIKAVQSASPAVVSIIITKDLPIFEKYYYNPFQEFEQFFGQDFNLEIPQYRQKGIEKKEIGGGTGFIISSDGLILSNKHVVEDEQADYTVLLNDGQQFSARVLAKDPIQDVAILKIESPKTVPVIKLGDSDNLKIGQTVIAIGNVLGEFRNSVSVGVISGLGRTITASGGSVSEVLEGIIQTDTAINAGNSGGPLLNISGEVIGMNTAMAIGAENVGFAIPINQAKKDIDQVKKSGKIVYAFLGIYYTLITPELQQEYNLLVDYGAWIGRDQSGQKTSQAIFPDSPAEKAGLKQDDIILEFNNEKITLNNSLAKLILKYNPGDEVQLKILRANQEKIIKVILGER